MNEYHQNALYDLQGRYPYLPRKYLQETFTENMRLFIPTGIAINDHLDESGSRPKWKGVEFDMNPLATERGAQPPASAHFAADTQILADGLGQEYCDLLQKQQWSLRHLPPIPDSPRKAPPKPAPGVDTVFPCDACGGERTYSFSKLAMCSATHLYCPVHLSQRIQVAIQDRSMAPGHKTVTCTLGDAGPHPFLQQIIQQKATVEEMAALQGAHVSTEYSVDTVAAGVCPVCYFPLLRTDARPNEWHCTHAGCGGLYYIKLDQQ
jgi:hypothetical protein